MRTLLDLTCEQGNTLCPASSPAMKKISISLEIACLDFSLARVLTNTACLAAVVL